MKKQQKADKNLEVKEFLDFQVNYRNRRLSDQKRANLEENSYSVLGSLFRERPSPYNRQKYV